MTVMLISRGGERLSVTTCVKYLGRRSWPQGAGRELQPGPLRNLRARPKGKCAEENLFLCFIFSFSSFSLSNCHGVFRLLFNDRLPQTEAAHGTSGWRAALATGRGGGGSRWLKLILGSREVAAGRPAQPPGHAPLSHHTSLTKHKYKDKII